MNINDYVTLSDSLYSTRESLYFFEYPRTCVHNLFRAHTLTSSPTTLESLVGGGMHLHTHWQRIGRDL